MGSERWERSEVKVRTHAQTYAEHMHMQANYKQNKSARSNASLPHAMWHDVAVPATERRPRCATEKKLAR